MRHLTVSIVLLLLFAHLLVADGIIDRQLQQKLQRPSRTSAKIPIIVYCKDVVSYEDVAREYRFLGDPQSIRGQALRVMKERVEQNYYWIRKSCARALADEITDLRPLWLVNAIALRATAAAIGEIANQPNVEKITSDEPVAMLSAEQSLTTLAGNLVSVAGYSGKGVTVAVVDTGVNIRDDLRNRVIDGRNYIDPDKPPRDDNCHGTNCAELIAGGNSLQDDAGVAPQAKILAIKVISAQGLGAWSHVYEAIAEAIDNEAKIIFLGTSGETSEITRERMRIACQNATQLGVILTTAAGISADHQKMSFPASIPEIISVGAGAYVTGVLALMVEANPALDVEQARGILTHTTVDKGTAGHDDVFDAGMIDTAAAIRAAESLHIHRDNRWEIVVKQIEMQTRVDSYGYIETQSVLQNDTVPMTTTLWIDISGQNARSGVYSLDFSVIGPEGTTTEHVLLDYEIARKSSPYGFKVGNFALAKGKYNFEITSASSNSWVQNSDITLVVRATWPPRREFE